MLIEARRKSLLILIFFFLLAWVVFPSVYPEGAWIVYLMTLPARFLGTFVHEMGHGFSALLTGGAFHWFQMDFSTGGVAITSGGIRVFIILGGLLGPAVLGAILLVASIRAKWITPSLFFMLMYFGLGVYYMLKPLWLSRSQYGFLDNWHIGLLLGLVVPLGGLVVIWWTLNRKPGLQSFVLQVLAVLVCFSAFSDTNYIFMFEAPGAGFFPDTRVVANTFWGGDPPPHWFFSVVAFCIAGMNFALLGMGTWWALRRPPRRAAAPNDHNKT